MEFNVYILYSHSKDRFYVGQTNDVAIRLVRHNQGDVPSTKFGLPWELKYSIPCATRSEAMLLEKKIKKRGIQRWLNDQSIKKG